MTGSSCSYFSLFLWILLRISWVLSENWPACDKQWLGGEYTLAHPTYCDRYFKCSHGKPSLFTCAYGQAYKHYSGCTLWNNAGCSSSRSYYEVLYPGIKHPSLIYSVPNSNSLGVNLSRPYTTQIGLQSGGLAQNGILPQSENVYQTPVKNYRPIATSFQPSVLQSQPQTSLKPSLQNPQDLKTNPEYQSHKYWTSKTPQSNVNQYQPSNFNSHLATYTEVYPDIMTPPPVAYPTYPTFQAETFETTPTPYTTLKPQYSSTFDAYHSQSGSYLKLPTNYQQETSTQDTRSAFSSNKQKDSSIRPPVSITSHPLIVKGTLPTQIFEVNGNVISTEKQDSKSKLEVEHYNALIKKPHSIPASYSYDGGYSIDNENPNKKYPHTNSGKFPSTPPIEDKLKSNSTNHSVLQQYVIGARVPPPAELLQVADWQCPKPNGLFRNPSGCGKFYKCDNGIPYSESCLSGLFFEESIGGCRHGTAKEVKACWP